MESPTTASHPTVPNQERGSPRPRILVAIALVILGALGALYSTFRFPSDRTPRGAYLRVAKAIVRDRPEEFFAYLEEPAQHAAYTIRDYRKKSLELVHARFPKEEQREYDEKWAAFASAPDGADVFAVYARREGWIDQLRADLSGVRTITENGDRATVETVGGTRYAFRKRPNGIWGMTAFSPLLIEEAERAARDQALLEKSAEDYARTGARK